MTHKQIADKLGTSRATVGHCLRQNPDYEHYTFLHCNGYSIRSDDIYPPDDVVATWRHLGWSPERIARACERFGGKCRKEA